MCVAVSSVVAVGPSSNATGSERAQASAFPAKSRSGCRGGEVLVTKVVPHGTGRQRTTNYTFALAKGTPGQVWTWSLDARYRLGPDQGTATSADGRVIVGPDGSADFGGLTTEGAYRTYYSFTASTAMSRCFITGSLRL